MSSGDVEDEVKGGQAVVGAGRLGLGEDVDVSLGGGTDRRWGRYGQDRDRYGDGDGDGDGYGDGDGDVLNLWGGYCIKLNLRGRA